MEQISQQDFSSAIMASMTDTIIITRYRQNIPWSCILHADKHVMFGSLVNIYVDNV